MHDHNSAMGENAAEGSPPYTVGYGRPPKAAQFKPGKSGNPKGRPKGRRDLEGEVREFFLAKVPIIEGGQRRYVSRFAAVYLSLWQNAMKGDVRAIKLFFTTVKDFKLDEAGNLVPGWTDEMFEHLSLKQLEQFVELEEIKQALLAGNIPPPEKRH